MAQKGKKILHGHTGDSRIEVRQRLPKSVVDFIRSTASLASDDASAADNSSFIDSFFNSHSRQDIFRVGQMKKEWVAPGMQHVHMIHTNKNVSSANNNQTVLNHHIDSDLFGIQRMRRNRYGKQRSFKWRLKKRNKHHQFIRECMKKEKQTLTIDKVLPLHKLWCEYADDVMIKNECTKKVKDTRFNNTVSKLDLHGCLIKIIQCKARRYYVKYEGVIVVVNKNRICIITSSPHKNKLICIPLKGTIFTFELRQRLVTIYGDHYNQFIP